MANSNSTLMKQISKTSSFWSSVGDLCPTWVSAALYMIVYDSKKPSVNFFYWTHIIRVSLKLGRWYSLTHIIRVLLMIIFASLFFLYSQVQCAKKLIRNNTSSNGLLNHLVCPAWCHLFFVIWRELVHCCITSFFSMPMACNSVFAWTIKTSLKFHWRHMGSTLEIRIRFSNGVCHSKRRRNLNRPIQVLLSLF